MNSERLRDILSEHVGRSNAIKSKHISTLMGFPMEDTQSVSRKAIWDTAERYHLPLVSCAEGYYIAESVEDLMKFSENIDHRIEGMQSLKNMVAENFFRMQNAGEEPS